VEGGKRKVGEEQALRRFAGICALVVLTVEWDPRTPSRLCGTAIR
jgi:hypothetical protein